MHQDIVIRPVRESDLRPLALLERNVWSRRETEILSESSLRKWYEEDSPFFLVAESNGILCGYYFARKVHFDLANIEGFLEEFAVGNTETTRHQGNSVYAQSIISVTPGAGVALHNRIHKMFKEAGVKYFVGFSRMPMFHKFAKKVELDSAYSHIPEHELALWYAHESTELMKMECWDECSPKPILPIPPLRRPDPVIAFHGQSISMSLLRVMPEYMLDPASRNYGAFLAAKIETAS